MMMILLIVMPASPATSPSTSAAAPTTITAIMLLLVSATVLFVHEVVFFREVEREIHAFLISDLEPGLFVEVLATPSSPPASAASATSPILLVILFLVFLVIESEQSIGLDDLILDLVLDVDMRGQLVRGAEGHVALLLAVVVGAQVVRFTEVVLQARIVRVVHVLILPGGAQVTGQVLSVQVVVELQVIEEVLLAEIAPGVRQDLCLQICAHITMIDVCTQLFQMI
jgi:hypothetical protein